MDDKRMRKLEEEDRLSALPDDLLHQILSSFNDTLFSATTSILSRRWPRLWVENPFLFFTDVPTRAHFMDSVDKALERYDCHGSLFINKFHIKIAEASNAARLNAWVGFAARHNVEVLHLKVTCECRQRLHLRLWECIREINLEYNLLIRFVKLPPPSPTFHSLKDLTLKGVHFSSKGYNLGDLLSYHCPRLESLKIVMVTGLNNLKISHPELSSLHIALGVPCIQEFILSAKKLADLFVENLFLGRLQNVVLKISAPSLSTFHWAGAVPPGATLGDFPKLKWGLFLFYSYCLPRTKQVVHQSIRKSLISFAHAQCLHVYIGYWRFSACLDFLDETSTLLRVKELSMFVCSNTHVFGQSVFNLLRICLGIEELHVKIARTNGLEGIARYRRCSCDLKQCWRSQTIPLNDLKRIEIKGFRGAQHEVDFVKLLLMSATILETLTIDYRGGTNSSSSVAQELLELPRASSRVIISQRF